MLELYIKNMVCSRCIMVVQDELVKLGFHPLAVEMGVVSLKEDSLSNEKRTEIDDKLREFGFELLDNSKTRLIDQIKNLVIEKVHRSHRVEEKVNWSKLISDQVFHEYNYLSALFSSVEGITLEQYIIRQK
ncbi:MAG: AraC family transcriptional regulator, partial [Daejeonella sp.]